MNQITSFPDALYPWDSLLFRESEGAEWERLGNVGASSGKRRTFSTRSEKKPDFVWTRRKKRCCYPARKARFCKRVGIHTAEPCHPLGFHGILAGRRPSTLGLRFLFREMQNPPNFKRFSPESCVEKNTRGSGVFLQCTPPHWRKTPDPLAFFSTGHSGNFLNKFHRIFDPGPQNLRAGMAG